MQVSAELELVPSMMSALLHQKLMPALLDLRDPGQARIILISVENEYLRHEAIDNLRRRLEGQYTIVDFDFADNEGQSFSRYCRTLQSKLPICVFAIGLERLRGKSQEAYENAIDLLNRQREDVRDSGAAVVFWISTAIERELLKHAPDFTDWATTNLKIKLFDEISELQHQSHRFDRMLSRPNLSQALADSFQERKKRLEDRIVRLNRQYDVSLSYSQECSEWASRLTIRLRDEGITVWSNQWEGRPAYHLSAWMVGAAPICSKFVPIWSHEYFIEPEANRMLERYLSRNLDPANRERPIVPILLEELELPWSHQQLRPIDFRNPEDFELRVRQLVQALELPGGIRNTILRGVDRTLDLDPSDSGRIGRFITEAAEIYRVLGFEIESDHRLGEDSFDLLIRKREGGLLTEAAIECWDHLPSEMEYSQFIQKIQRIRVQNSRLNLIVLSSIPLPRELIGNLESRGIYLVLYSDLQQELVPLDSYTRREMEDFERWRTEHWRGEDRFIRPDVILDPSSGEKETALAVVSHWLGTSNENLLLVFGDAGSGKSTLVRFLAYEMARNFQEDPHRHPAPILIPLGNARQEISLEGVIISHFGQVGLPLTDYKRFAHLANEGKVVLLFDAFDEMADRVRPDVVQHNLRELLRPAVQGWKALLTCRTNYFKDYKEQSRFLAQKVALSGIERKIYQDLERGTGHKVVYLTEFSDQQVRDYLKRVRGESAAADWEKIKSIYSLEELAQQPLLLEMIVDSLPQLESGQRINAANLFAVYTSFWVDREAKKGRLLDSQFRLSLMMELAWWMWKEGHENIRYAQLLPFVNSLMNDLVLNQEIEKQTDWIRELQTASFLKRELSESGDTFAFSHPAFMEYFLARKLHDVLSRPDNQSEIKKLLLHSRPFDRKVIFFLSLMDDSGQFVDPLREILTEGYSPIVSENALNILYWSTRVHCGMEESILDIDLLQEKMAIRIPTAIKMRKAEMEGMILEGINLINPDFHGADLSRVRFNYASLVEADFRQADLDGACFDGATLKHCDFTKARNIQSADFGNVKMIDVKGLGIKS